MTGSPQRNINARVVELADTSASRADAVRHGGSTPLLGTMARGGIADAPDLGSGY